VISDALIRFTSLKGEVLCCGFVPQALLKNWTKFPVRPEYKDRYVGMETETMKIHFGFDEENYIKQGR
jgi:hypothetical protein